MSWRQRGGLGRWHGPGPERLWRRLPRPRVPGFRWPDRRTFAGIVALVLAALPLVSVFFLAAGFVPAVPEAAWTGTPGEVVMLVALLTVAFWPAALAWTTLFTVLALWALSR